ncbi:hypothetical protein SPIRO4BDMA_40626 [uncultured spirochete]|uniref:Uncharacterized protein n=1 Tax=uncultured spirochete TaxID=156406 RepID=A0A3P3XP79_9SPIR|nr:hypothetical protein SPIRO4BDMA_40626 [uncultured spirochete]
MTLPLCAKTMVALIKRVNNTNPILFIQNLLLK